MPLAIAAQAGIVPEVGPTTRDRGAPHAGRSRTARASGPRTTPAQHLARTPCGRTSGTTTGTTTVACRAGLGRAAGAAARAAGRARPPDRLAGGRRRRRGRRGRGLPLPRHRRPAAAGLAAAQRVDGSRAPRGTGSGCGARPSGTTSSSRRCRRPGTSSGRSRPPSCCSCGPAASRSRRACSATRSRSRSSSACSSAGSALVGALYLGPGGSRVRRPLAGWSCR